MYVMLRSQLPYCKVVDKLFDNFENKTNMALYVDPDEQTIEIHIDNKANDYHLEERESEVGYTSSKESAKLLTSENDDDRIPKQRSSSMINIQNNN